VDLIVNFKLISAILLTFSHPLNVYAGTLPSYPGQGIAEAEGATGVDAEILLVPTPCQDFSAANILAA
jgi:hypothetical protein